MAGKGRCDESVEKIWAVLIRATLDSSSSDSFTKNVPVINCQTDDSLIAMLVVQARVDLNLPG